MSDQFPISYAALERSLADEQSLIQTLLDSLPLGVCQVDAAGKVLCLNLHGVRILGRTEHDCKGQSLHSLIDCHLPSSQQSSFTCPIEQVLNTGNTVHTYQSTLRRHNGQSRYVEYQCVSLSQKLYPGALLYFKEVSELVHHRDERQRILKLQSLERLASRIGHQFDNLVTAILGNLFVAKLRASGTSSIAISLQEAERSCLQAKDITKEILSFSQETPPKSNPIAIPDIIRTTTAEVLANSTTVCEYHFPEDLWLLKVDPLQFKRVVEQVTDNARQAMSDAGILLIQAENVTIPDVGTHPPPILNPGPYVKLSFEDQGRGIPQDQLLQVFDPYYTTAPSAHGLGLTIVHSIVRQYSGHVTIHSTLGEGTVLSLYWPTYQVTSTPHHLPLHTIPKGEGRILVMDDDIRVLTMVQDALTQFGYEAIGVQDGEKAIALFTKSKQTGQQFAVVLLDLIVQSGMGGKDTLDHLLKIDPYVKTILTSGYADSPVTMNYRKYGFSANLVKPYTITQLHQVLETVLHSDTSTFQS